MKTIASLWIGDSLGLIEKASILSFLNHGHKFVLYTYGQVKGIPVNVEVKDANDIFPDNPILLHKKTRSPALHSDLFRYTLMDKTDYIWVDLDIIALKPFDFQSDWIVGFEANYSISGAVFRVPKTSHTIQALLKLEKDTKGIPPVLKGFQRFRYQLKSLAYGGLSIDRWPYAITGPGLITYYMKKFQEDKFALPPAVFYCIPIEEVGKLLTPFAITKSSLPKTAYGVHLWGKELRAQLDEIGGEIPKNCFLDELLSQINS